MRLSIEQMKKRDLMLLDLLGTNPKLTHEEAIAASREKFNTGIAFDRWKKLKDGAKNGPPARVDHTKKALKRGTKPLKVQVKELGKALAESGVDEAVMKVIDGVPHWHIVEKRSYDL